MSEKKKPSPVRNYIGLAVLVILLGVAAWIQIAKPAWLSSRVNQMVHGTGEPGTLSDSQKKLREEIYKKLTEKKGLVVLFKGKINSVNMPSGTCDAEAVTLISQLPYLQTLSLEGGELTLEQCKQLRNLRNLNTLNLTYAKIPPQGLRYFAAFPNLTACYLTGTKVRADALRYLENHAALKILNISECDAGVPEAEVLARIPHLTWIIAQNSPGFTDESLFKLSVLSDLGQVTLGKNAGVTAGGVRKFGSLSPKCKVD